jgi:hypothetical protein
VPAAQGVLASFEKNRGNLFTFDSSRYLNCHSNFNPKIAATGTLLRGRSGGLKKREANMADLEMMVSDEVTTEGCFGLGMIYSAGAGVAIDLVQAHKWFNIAAMRGHKDAARLRREVAEQMSDSDIGSAQRAARDWLKSHPQPQAPVEPIRIAA